jgi:hypothetical protein
MDEQRRAGSSWWIALVLCGLLAYPLSVGPISWLANHDVFSESTMSGLELFYSPLSVVADNDIPVLTWLLDGYLAFWE